MKRGFSLASLIGKAGGKTHLPDLGTRELAVLEVMWRQEPVTSQAVLDALCVDAISLSTVQSTLERLYRKDLVAREKVGRSYVYRALLSRENIISRLMHDIADSLTDGDSAPMVSGFLDYLEDDETARKAHPGKGRRER